jgi:hypothetical protein
MAFDMFQRWTTPNKPLQRTNDRAPRSTSTSCRAVAGCAGASSRPCYARSVRLAFAAERQIVEPEEAFTRDEVE